MDAAQRRVQPLLTRLNQLIGKNFEEWDLPSSANPDWSAGAERVYQELTREIATRKLTITESVNAKADFKYIYDKPFEDKQCVRVAGPFTIESLSPHRALGVNENDELIDPLDSQSSPLSGEQSFTQAVLENLSAAGMQQAQGPHHITGLNPWPGDG